ncbi:MAG: peptidoglycan DD-metalloendopeptidase family protein [Holophaga sp.]|nr:peptidoglycan DD-metalloendopeptidase family protein [Holophaga sp.]
MKGVRLLLLGACLGLLAQPPAPARTDSAQLKHRLAEVQARLGTVEVQLEALKKRRKGVLVELQATLLDADRMRAQAETARLKRDQAQAEVNDITARKDQIMRDIVALRSELRKQVRWMQAKGPLGDLTFLSGLSSFESYVVEGRYQVYLRNQERKRLDLIQSLQDDLAKREHELQAALQHLALEEQLSNHTQGSLQLHEQRLQQFLDGLRQDESRQKEVQAELAEEALQLERMLAQLLGKPRSDPFETTNTFAALHGELPQPTPGTLAQPFGEHVQPLFRTKTMQSGLLIAGQQGAPVQAVADGKVVFADLYQSYGPMVILDHGGGYFSLYTHLEAVAVAKGQILRQGESLGAMGLTVDGPRLGFEIRHLTQPQDPNKWLKVHYR